MDDDLHGGGGQPQTISLTGKPPAVPPMANFTGNPPEQTESITPCGELVLWHTCDSIRLLRAQEWVKFLPV